ncbi:hypothetical protein [Dictyobacter arantiisoli]|uniref:Uncharacterized protein n=1 Tax=Dictyobacter arantiisoli TaxID=2014874 RepID=A0A5A5TFK0_9CHLR|nr:hypothetical protein [Dictyobacter arantiisoli]GCF10350.1 hypothetical protein KDI_39140 [Dictyobacter arantiisoli]
MLDIDAFSQSLDPMTILQNCWYNGFIAGLQASPTTAQIIQPAPPMRQTNAGLWTYENTIPPASLTFNTDLYRSKQFFDNYASVIRQLQFPQDSFKQDIGVDAYQQWTRYVSQLQPSPTPDQIPAVFHDWAIQLAPAAAQVGTADLTQRALIEDAQHSLALYEGSNARPVDFDGSFTQLLQILQQSSSVQFSFDSSTSNSDVSDTWTGGVDTGIYGLWTGCGSTSPLSQQFARSKVTVTVHAKAYTIWRSIPGTWYNSSLLNNAYSNIFTPPWPANAHPNWNDVFAPTGSMHQLIASLLVMDGMHIIVTSNATYAGIDQQTILSNTSSGLWPFFIPNSSSIVTNTITFGSTSGMQIETVTQPGTPIAVGANVLDIAHYLGHEIA